MKIPALLTGRPGVALRGVALALAAVTLSNLTGCVSADEHKRLQTAFEQARQQLAEAENDLATTRARIAELEARLAELNRLLDNNGSGLGAIRRERDLLAAQLADLQNKYNDLLKLNQNAPALPEPINAALRDLAAKYPELLEFDERLGMIRFKSDLTFDVGSTEVKPRAREALATFAHILNMPEIANNEVQVVGHTDDIPIRAGGPTATRNPDNWTLSTNRAWSVVAVLRSNGLSTSRGMASGWGDQRPVAPNIPGQGGNERNRRVDIYIRPTKVPEGIVVSTPGTRAPAAPVRRTTPPARTPATRPAAPASPAAPAAPTVPVPF
jgi:chemotaxis protein MotB